MEIFERDAKKNKPGEKDLKFGRTYTDHMLLIEWSKRNGWGKPNIVPYGPIKLDVNATSLHYGISCYECCNITKNKQTNVSQAFRPELHLNQFLDSSNHIDMPLFDTNELFQCVKELVKIDKDWFPNMLDDPS